MNARLRVYIGPLRKRKDGGHYPRWPYRYQLPGQPWVHGMGAFTEASTRQLVDALIREHLLKLKLAEHGVTEAALEPIEKHLEEYLRWGRLSGGKGGLPWSAGHLAHRASQLKGWIRALKLARLADITYDRFALENTARLERGLAPNTVNHHAWALVSFVEWCRARGRVTVNCLAAFTSLDKRPRRERGAFGAEEFQALLRAAPPARRLVYRLAVYSGLRRSALAALRPRDVDFASGVVTLRWTDAKNRKTTVKPLPPLLLADLRAHCEGRDAEGPLLDFTPGQAARAIHRDMEAAGLPVEKDGRRRDFHSLKASLGTLLDDCGTPPEITQRALDHAAFTQTRAYIKRELGPLREAVSGLEFRLDVPGFHASGDAARETPDSWGEITVALSPSHSAGAGRGACGGSSRGLPLRALPAGAERRPRPPRAIKASKRTPVANLASTHRHVSKRLDRVRFWCPPCRRCRLMRGALRSLTTTGGKRDGTDGTFLVAARRHLPDLSPFVPGLQP